ncbi:MAG: hypothetical protein HOH04_00795 [Rhodospirillaceae bacterium]|jgi:hypothetical protein|nr:hypothetical protein [Rhodospirillaceae bacterium]
MKLDAQQLALVENQTGAKPVPADDPAVEQLSGAFGDHSFFLDPNGLYIFEAVDLPDTEAGTSPALLIQVAEWTGEDKSAIGAIEPKPADLIIDLAMELPAPE